MKCVDIYDKLQRNFKLTHLENMASFLFVFVFEGGKR